MRVLREGSTIPMQNILASLFNPHVRFFILTCIECTTRSSLASIQPLFVVLQAGNYRLPLRRGVWKARQWNSHNTASLSFIIMGSCHGGCLNTCVHACVSVCHQHVRGDQVSEQSTHLQNLTFQLCVAPAQLHQLLDDQLCAFCLARATLATTHETKTSINNIYPNSS